MLKPCSFSSYIAIRKGSVGVYSYVAIATHSGQAPGHNQFTQLLAIYYQFICLYITDYRQ